MLRSMINPFICIIRFKIFNKICLRNSSICANLYCKESCQSGLTYLFAKEAGCKSPREFESRIQLQKNRRFLIHHSGLLKETCLRDRKTGGTTLINHSISVILSYTVNAGSTPHFHTKAPRPVLYPFRRSLSPDCFFSVPFSDIY